MSHVPAPDQRSEPHTPWHTWVVATFMLLLYLIGSYDFIMLLGPNEDYVLSQDWGAAGIAYFTEYPLALRLVWAVHVACGLFAPVLLVIRVRAAPVMALTAWVTQLFLMLATFTLMERLMKLGTITALFDISILMVTVSFWWYCRQRVPFWSSALRPKQNIGRGMGYF